ncbi:MAG: hypothetical protein R3208_20360 [Ketobacteraceae bacterium]|nr:hypothetical protein [Ketobacteraceae bacterium]
MTAKLPELNQQATAHGNPYGYPDKGRRVPLIETGKPATGPVTKARLQRTLMIYGLLFLMGNGLALSGNGQLAALGLGITFPGAGFLVHATGDWTNILIHAGFFMGTLVAFVISLFLWVATGNLLAPLALWTGSALYAASMNHHHYWEPATVIVPVFILIGGLGFLLHGHRRIQQLKTEQVRINRYLKNKTTVTTPLNDSGLPRVDELPASSAPLLRFILDRALQPLDTFHGFDRIDEFREAAKRYQLCNSSYALSLLQYNHTPAFRGYLSQAQENLSLKMQDHRCWSYWRYENLWGNFKSNPDPMAFDNIMYYGWYGAMLGMNASNEANHRFSEPGAIRLEHPKGQVFSYSFHDICEIIYKNFKRSEFCLFPCEPRWIYPMCNNFGAVSLILHDRLYGTNYWADVGERYIRQLSDEFITLDGRVLAIRDYRTGLTVPGLTSSMADAAAAYFMTPVAPDLARRSWEILRHDFITQSSQGIQLKTNGWDNIDFGNYRPSKATTYGLIAAAAREVGDTEISDLMLDKLDATHSNRIIDGIQHYDGASVSAHAVIFCARNMRPNGLHDLINVGMPRPWQDGPLLEKAAYPKVLVTRAVSDGKALELTLVPGQNAAKEPLTLSQLQPGRTYRVTGAEERQLTAGTQGRATIHVVLDSTKQVVITPFM